MTDNGGLRLIINRWSPVITYILGCELRIAGCCSLSYWKSTIFLLLDAHTHVMRSTQWLSVCTSVTRRYCIVYIDAVECCFDDLRSEIGPSVDTSLAYSIVL